MIHHLPYPLTLLLAVALAATGLGLGAPPALTAGLTVLVMLGVVAAWERVLPHEHAWVPTWRRVLLDVTHMGMTSAVVIPVVRTVLTVAIGAATATFLADTGWAPWPAGWPVALQLVFAIVVADLGAYVAHRTMHATDAGWWIHAVHHTPKGLHVVASARSHPFNAAFTYAAETGLLLALGIPVPALVLWSVVKATNGMLQHANVAYARGPWSWVLATPEVHRWHHSVHLDESNTNFGNTTVIWDRLFGTLHLPPDRRPGRELGIAGDTLEEGYLAHLAAPIVLARSREHDRR